MTAAASAADDEDDDDEDVVELVALVGNKCFVIPSGCRHSSLTNDNGSSFQGHIHKTLVWEHTYVGCVFKQDFGLVIAAACSRDCGAICGICTHDPFDPSNVHP